MTMANENYWQWIYNSAKMLWDSWDEKWQLPMEMIQNGFATMKRCVVYIIPSDGHIDDCMEDYNDDDNDGYSSTKKFLPDTDKRWQRPMEMMDHGLVTE